jgi:hypothetical protein
MTRQNAVMIGERARDVSGRPSTGPGDDSKSSVTAGDRQSQVERRAEHRIRTLIYGKLIIDDGLASLDCVVRNRSAGGAQVRVLGAEEPPPTVRLLFITEGLLFDATVVWRRGDKIGLAFSGHHDLRHDDDPRLTAIHALWMDVAQREHTAH